jgi:hypothetical protein
MPGDQSEKQSEARRLVQRLLGAYWNEGPNVAVRPAADFMFYKLHMVLLSR